MARSVETIKNDIKVKVRTYPSLDVFKFPEDTPAGSKVGVFNLFIDIVSMAIFTFEVILDQLKADITKVAEGTAAGNNKWLQNQMFEFQYGDTIELTDFVPAYPVPDDSKKIVTQCAVRDIGNGIVSIRVAKGSVAPFLPLTAPELTALRNYYYGTATTEGIGFAGVKAQFTSLDPDRMYIAANLYFFGQYVEATVKTNVIAAIDAFLQSFADEAFGGRVFMIKLVDAIQAVPGVSRVELTSIKARANATPFGSGADIGVQAYYDTVAGHIISEDTGGSTLADTITMLEEV